MHVELALDDTDELVPTDGLDATRSAKGVHRWLADDGVDRVGARDKDQRCTSSNVLTARQKICVVRTRRAIRSPEYGKKVRVERKRDVGVCVCVHMKVTSLSFLPSSVQLSKYIASRRARRRASTRGSMRELTIGVV